MDTRDLSIIAQNAGSTAAVLVGEQREGEDLTTHLARYDLVRQHVINGTLRAARGEQIVGGVGVSGSDPQPSEAEATEAIKEAFGGAEEVPTTFRIIEKGSTGQPAPDWLAREVAYQVKQGKVAADDTDLFDNRGSLPQFGGDGNPNAPWFRTAKGKVGLWPPRKKGGK